MLALAFCASASVVPISTLGLNPWGLSSLGVSPLGLSPLRLSPWSVSPWASAYAIQPQAISLSQGIAAPHLIGSGITLQAARLAPIAAPLAAPIAIAAAEG